MRCPKGAIDSNKGLPFVLLCPGWGKSLARCFILLFSSLCVAPLERSLTTLSPEGSYYTLPLWGKTRGGKAVCAPKGTTTSLLFPFGDNGGQSSCPIRGKAKQKGQQRAKKTINSPPSVLYPEGNKATTFLREDKLFPSGSLLCPLGATKGRDKLSPSVRFATMNRGKRQAVCAPKGTTTSLLFPSGSLCDDERRAKTTTLLLLYQRGNVKLCPLFYFVVFCNRVLLPHSGLVPPRGE